MSFDKFYIKPSEVKVGKVLERKVAGDLSKSYEVKSVTKDKRQIILLEREGLLNKYLGYKLNSQSGKYELKGMKFKDSLENIDPISIN